jgi:YVTN family beta-propeller protein
MSLDARARRAVQAARGNVDRLPPPPAIGVLVRRRRRRVAAGNALAVAVLVAVGTLAWRILPVGAPQPAATGLPRHVQAGIRVGEAPGAVAVDGSSVWVANSGDGTVSRIDPASNRVIATVHVGGHPTRLTADAGAVWVTSPGRMQWIDPGTNQVVQTLPLPVGLGEVALAFDGCLWVSLNDGTVRWLNPFNGQQFASVPVASRGVSMLAWGESTLWAANGGTLVGIRQVEPQVTTRFALRRDGNRNPRATDLAVVGASLWVVDSDGQVIRFPVDRPEGQLGGELVSREGSAAIAAGPTGVFLASRSSQTVTRFDPATGQAEARIYLPDASDVAVGAGAVWTTAPSRDLLYRIDPNATD